MSTFTLICATVPDFAMAIVLETPAALLSGMCHHRAARWPDATTACGAPPPTLNAIISRRRGDIGNHQPDSRPSHSRELGDDADDRAMPWIAP